MGVAYITSLIHIHGTPTSKASEALRLEVGQNILTMIIAPPAVRRVIFSKCTVLYSPESFSHTGFMV